MNTFCRKLNTKMKRRKSRMTETTQWIQTIPVGEQQVSFVSDSSGRGHEIIPFPLPRTSLTLETARNKNHGRF